MIFEKLNDAQVAKLAKQLVRDFGVEGVIFTSQNIIKKYNEDTEDQVNLRYTYNKLIKYIDENY